MYNKNSDFDNTKYENETGFKNLYKLPFYKKNFQSQINQGYLVDSGKNKKALKDFQDLIEIIIHKCNIS